MLQTRNSAAMRALAVVMNALLAFCAIFVFGMGFTSCDTGIDDVVVNQKPCENGDCPDNPDQPDVTVVEVHHDGCDVLGKVEWSFKNAVETKATEYSVDASDGGAFASVRMQYNANIEYSDGSFESKNPVYTVNNAVVGFGYAQTLVVKKGDIDEFKKEPSVSTSTTTNGKVTFLKWAPKTLAFLANSTFSVKSLTIGGETKTDLCENGISYKFSHTEVIADGDSIGKFNMYNVRIHGTATVAQGEDNTRNFYITLRVAELKENGINPPAEEDPEFVDYDVINQEINNNQFTGDLVEIWSDGSTTDVGVIKFNYNSSDLVPENKTVKVGELTYSKLDPAFGYNLRTGNNRSLEALGCQIELTEMKNTVIMMTNRGALEFGRTFEYAVLTAPNGKQIELKGMDAKIEAGSISDNGASNNQLTITMTATGNSSMSATLTLVKEGSDPSQKIQIDAYAKDQHIENGWIKWTLVRIFSDDTMDELPMSFAHKYSIATEARKSTNNRIYTASNGAMTLLSSEDFNEDNYSGTFKKYSRTFTYNDFTNTIKAEGRDYIIYNDNGFDVEVWNTSLSIEKQGIKLATNYTTDGNYRKYIDQINYSLFAGSVSVADGIQEVEYSEEVTPIDPTPDTEYTYSVEKDQVEGNKLYFFKITKNKNSGAIISKDRDSQYLVFSLNATAAADWSIKEGEAAGMTLTSSSFNYSSAKDYIFGSNRGDNKAAVSLQTEYTVTFGGQEFTLTVDGEVKGEVAKTSSTSTSNTYTFTGSLYVDGVKVASDSDQAVETINKGEEDKITRSVEKIGVSNGNLNYYYIVKHSVQTNLDSRTQHSVPVEASATATACADWTVNVGEITGLTLSATSFSYTGAQDYVFGSNRGNNIVNAYLKEKYVVTHDGQDFELSVTGSVTGSVTNSGNTYTFTGKVLADGVEVAASSDVAVETVKELDYIQIVSVESTLAATTTPGVYTPVFVAHYEDGLSVSSTGTTSTDSRVNSMAGDQLVYLQQSGNTWSWGGLVNVSMQSFTYKGMNSPILTVTATTVNSDGSYSVANNLGNTYTFPKRSK